MSSSRRPYLIGITGGSASGKTHFLNSLRSIFSESEVCIISQDNYYKTAFEHKRDENGHINFDLPECVDLHQFAVDIAKLGRGEKVEREEKKQLEKKQKPSTGKDKPPSGEGGKPTNPIGATKKEEDNPADCWQGGAYKESPEG